MEVNNGRHLHVTDVCIGTHGRSKNLTNGPIKFCEAISRWTVSVPHKSNSRLHRIAQFYSLKMRRLVGAHILLLNNLTPYCNKIVSFIVREQNFCTLTDSSNNDSNQNITHNTEVYLIKCLHTNKWSHRSRVYYYTFTYEILNLIREKICKTTQMFL